MKILINTFGSHGDVLPFIAIAQELTQRGHEPVLFANGGFSSLAAQAGVPFVPTGTAELQARFLRDPNATDPRKGLALLAEGVLQGLQHTVQLMEAAHEPGRTLVVGSSMAWGGRLFAERHRVPMATMHLAASWFRSEYLAPAFSPMGHLEKAPRVVKRWLWSMMDKRFLDPLFTEPFNRIRAELGLGRVTRMYHAWLHEADLTLGLFPEWFAPRQPDWPHGLQLTGFPVQTSHAALDPKLEAFLKAGDPPVAFTAGTANASSHAFFATSAEACRLSGRRGLLITQSAAQLPASLPEGVTHVAYAPFETLLPRVSALVHHGGIGTTSQALLAGVPQLVRPMGFDQFDNARRAMKLGVARQLLPRRYRAKAVARTLEALIGDAVLQAQCRQVAQRMAREPSGAAAACDALLALQR